MEPWGESAALLAGRHALEHPFGRQQAHLAGGLANGGDAGSGHRRRLHVVEAQHRAILRHPHAGGGEAADHAQGGEVVKGQNRGEGLSRGHHPGRAVDSALEARGRVDQAGELENQPWVEVDSGLGCRGAHPGPARRTVEQLLGAADHRDAAMAQLVVHQHRADPQRAHVAADNHNRDVVLFDVAQQVGLVEDPTGDDDDPFGATLQDHLQIAVEEIALGLRVHQQGEEAGGLQAGLDAANDGDAEGVGQVVGQHPDGLASAAAEGW